MFRRAKTLIAAACLLAAAAVARAAAPTPSVTAASTGSVNVSWSGGTSPFVAAISTSSSFSVYSASGSLAGTSTGYPSLDPNTTYYFKIKSAGDPDSLYSAVLTTTTRAAAPAGVYTLSAFFTADASTTAALSVAWDPGGNPAHTAYELRYSTDSAFSPSTTVLAGYPPAAAGGLSANTTYYLSVRARGLSGVYTAFTSAVSTATLAMRLQGVGDSVHETSATVTWTALNDPADQALRSGGYQLNYSPNSSMSPYASWSSNDMDSSSAALSGLLRNTSYYYQAGSLNLAGRPNLLELRQFTTLGARPSGLSRLAVSDGSATLGWTALAASDAAGYRLQASTSALSWSAAESTDTYLAALSTLTLNTLMPNTTYYFRAGSLNKAGIPNFGSQVSSITLALPVSPDLAWSYADPHRVTVTFIPHQASPQAFASEGYRLEASTAAFGSGGAVLSSVTLTYQEGLRSLVLDGLAANTVYHLRLASLNWQRTPNFAVLASTKTGFPAPLSDVAVAAAWSSSVTLSYTPYYAAEAHVAQASTHRYFYTVDATSATVSTSAASLTITGLSANTTYYYRVGTLFNGTTIYANSSPQYRQTLPLQVGTPYPSGVFQSSISVSWTPLDWAPAAASAEYYLLQASTAPGFASVLASSATYNIALATLTITGLSPNATYYFRVGSANQEGSINYASLSSTVTLANPPVQLGYNILPNALTPRWSVNSNPADTRYVVEMSSYSNFTFPQPSSTTVLSSATFSGLSPNTTYYTRVTALNRLNRAIPAVDFTAMATGAFDPGARAPSGITTDQFAVNWSSGAAAGRFNAAGTWYLAYISSNTDFSGTVHSSETLALSSTFYGLVSDATYYLRVSALNLTGVPTDPAVDLGAVLTLPATAYILQPPSETFTGMLLDGFTVNWAANGNSSYTVYHVVASTDPLFSVTNSSRLVNALSCDFDGLQLDTQYWVRIQARGQGGAVASYVDAGSTRTLFSTQQGAAAGQVNEVVLETSYGDISVLLPRGALGGYTNFTLLSSTYALPGPDSAVTQLTPTGIGLVLGIFPRTLLLNPVTVTLPYRLADLPAGIDRSRLVLAVYSAEGSVWVPLASVSETSANRVRAQAWNLPVSQVSANPSTGQALYLSKFQLMQSNPPSGLGAVRVYPNPFRPNSVYDVMHFANLPPFARVKIYTFLGELVRSLKADANGLAHWDGTNDSGRKAASGVYIALIKSGGADRSFKVALER